MTDAVLQAAALIGAGVEVLQGLLKVVELDPVQAGATEPAAWRAVLERVDQLERCLAAGKLRVVRIGDQVQAGRQEGLADPAAWVGRTTRTDRRDAARNTDLASRLRTVAPPSPERVLVPASGAADGTDVLEGTPSASRTESATERALDAGEISPQHAHVIVNALGSLPARLSLDEVRAVEAMLLTQARVVTPGHLRVMARRAIEAVEPDPQVVDATEDSLVQREEEAAYRASSFWMRDNDDGTTSGRFTVPWASGAVLRTVLDAMTSPRKDGGRTTPSSRAGCATASAGRPAASSQSESGMPDGVPTCPSPTLHRGGVAAAAGLNPAARQPGTAMSDRGEDSWKSRTLDWTQRRGMAFADLLTLIPTDHLPNRATATLIVHTDLETLRGQVDRAARTSGDDKLSASQVRWLACQAGIVPAVMGGASAPLDLGRSARLFTLAQRLALSVRYQTCAVAGCERPFAWSEVHHLRPWEKGGRTNLDDGVPLCGPHHRWTHHPDSEFEIRRDATGRAVIHFTRTPRIVA